MRNGHAAPTERGRPRPQSPLAAKQLVALCAHCGRGRPRSNMPGFFPTALYLHLLRDVDRFRNTASRTDESCVGGVKPFRKGEARHYGLFVFGFAFANEARPRFRSIRRGSEVTLAMPAYPPEAPVIEIVQFDHKAKTASKLAGRCSRTTKRDYSTPLRGWVRVRAGEPRSLTGTVIVLPAR